MLNFCLQNRVQSHCLNDCFCLNSQFRICMYITQISPIYHPWRLRSNTLNLLHFCVVSDNCWRIRFRQQRGDHSVTQSIWNDCKYLKHNSFYLLFLGARGEGDSFTRQCLTLFSTIHHGSAHNLQNIFTFNLSTSCNIRHFIISISRENDWILVY